MWNIGAVNDQPVNEQALEGEESETLNRVDKARMSPTQNVQLRIDLLTKVSVHEKTLKGDNTDNTRIPYEQINGFTNIG